MGGVHSQCFDPSVVLRDRPPTGQFFSLTSTVARPRLLSTAGPPAARVEVLGLPPRREVAAGADMPMTVSEAT